MDDVSHEKSYVPAFVSIVTLCLGFFDLLRGFAHTVKLEPSAIHIAGLDLSIIA